MNRVIEIGAMLLGSVSLLLVSFLGFAVMSGVPLHDVAVIGGLFEGPEGGEMAEDRAGADPMADASTTSTPAPTRSKSPQAVVSSSMGLMGAYALPAPYTQQELQGLAEEIKGRAARLDARDLELDQREAATREIEEGYEQRLLALEDLQKQMDKFQRELLARELEIKRDENAKEMGEVQRYAEIAKVLESLGEASRVSMLTDYEPTEAAKILVALSEKVRDKTMSAMAEKLTPVEMRTYVEAYSVTVQDLGTK